MTQRVRLNQISKYYRLRKKGRLPAHDENPPKSILKNVNINRRNKTHIARFQQDNPKNATFEDYCEIYKKQIIEKWNEYLVSKVSCVIKIRMQRNKLNGEYINEVFPFESDIHIITDGTDLDYVFNIIYKKIYEKRFWMDYC